MECFRRRRPEKNLYSEPLPFLEKQELQKYLKEESQSLDDEAFNDPQVKILRDDVLFWIADYSKTDNFDASIPYLAMNYFDRFISRHTLPTVGAKGVIYRVRVLAISLLSIAWKMRNRFFRKKMFLESRKNLNIAVKDINKVESLILRKLEGRLYCAIALSFVSNFLSLVSEPRLSFKSDIVRLIIQSQKDIRFTQFKPSIIAASAILATYTTGHPSECKEKFTGGDIKLDSIKLRSCSLMMDVFRKHIFIPIEIANKAITQGSESSSRTEAAAAEASSSHEIEEVSGQRPGEDSTSDGLSEMEQKLLMDWELNWMTGEGNEESSSGDKELMNIELKWTSEQIRYMTMLPSLFPPDPNEDQEECISFILQNISCCINID